MNKQCKILYSKLERPVLQNNLIARQRLLEEIDGASQRMVILHGTLGYGKTVLMNQYVQYCGMPWVWYHLDITDDKPGVFFSYLSAAFKRRFPDFDLDLGGYEEGSEGYLQAETDFLIRLNNLLEPAKNKKAGMVLVLDEFQSISHRHVLSFLRRLTEFASGDLRILLAVKGNLPSFTASLLLAGQALVIGPEGLSFTESEVKDFLDKRIKKWDPAWIGKVYETTQGWPAGLEFAVQYMERFGAGKPEPDWDRIGTETLLHDYLMNELFCKQPENVQEFLLATAFLEEMDAKTCANALHLTDAGNILDRLNRQRLFVSPDKEKKECYHYHPLFGQFLQRQVSARQKSTLFVSQSIAVTNSRIQVRFFGPFQVIVGGHHEMTWRTRKTAELFACLAERGGKPVKRNELLRILWPDNYPNNAVAMLHNMIYSIRRELAPFGLSQLLQYKNREYLMPADLLDCDLERIEKLCRAVEEKDLAYLTGQEDAFSSYWGIYLDGMENSWCELKKYYYEKCFIGGCELLGDFFLREGRWKDGVRVLKAGLEVDSYSEALAVKLMKCYIGLRDKKEGKKLYDSICKIYRFELESTPDQAFVEAYEACIHG